MSAARTPMIVLLAWLPLVAALELAAGPARLVAGALLRGLGGGVASPLAELVTTPASARVRRVRRARAPDAAAHCCGC